VRGDEQSVLEPVTTILVCTNQTDVNKTRRSTESLFKITTQNQFFIILIRGFKLLKRGSIS